MARRGLNIYKRRDGRWEGRYKCGYTADGKAKYRSVYAKSYSAVKLILEERRAAESKGLTRCTASVGEIINLWLSDVRLKVKESTYANYAMKLKKHILPCFAGLKYDMLTAQRLNEFICCKQDSGLSAKYISDIVIILKSAAKFVSKNYGYVNRIEYVTLPKSKEKAEKILLDKSEQNQLRTALINNSTPSDTGILLASVTGIRIGELCALKWSDIDFEKGILTVRRTVQRVMKDGGGTKLAITSPKSDKSRREVPLPDFIIPILKANRSASGNYILSGSEKLTEPRTMQYRFKSLLKKLNLPEVNFHSLRHMFATNCISVGFDVKTLSEILGHSSVETTLNRYVHSSIEQKISCMKMLSDNILVG